MNDADIVTVNGGDERRVRLFYRYDIPVVG
jgi:hypothetical protein